jgi:hypothetical protein
VEVTEQTVLQRVLVETVFQAVEGVLLLLVAAVQQTQVGEVATV